MERKRQQLARSLLHNQSKRWRCERWQEKTEADWKENNKENVTILEDSQMSEMKVKAEWKETPSTWSGQQERSIYQEREFRKYIWNRIVSNTEFGFGMLILQCLWNSWGNNDQEAATASQAWSLNKEIRYGDPSAGTIGTETVHSSMRAQGKNGPQKSCNRREAPDWNFGNIINI